MENPALSHFLCYQCLTSCKKSKKSLEWKYQNFLTEPLLTKNLTLWFYAPLKWRIVLYIPRVIFQERSMVLTCGFRSKLDNTWNFYFQWWKAQFSSLDFSKNRWIIQKTQNSRQSGVLLALKIQEPDFSHTWNLSVIYGKVGSFDFCNKKWGS